MIKNEKLLFEKLKEASTLLLISSKARGLNQIEFDINRLITESLQLIDIPDTAEYFEKVKQDYQILLTLDEIEKAINARNFKMD